MSEDKRSDIAKAVITQTQIFLLPEAHNGAVMTFPAHTQVAFAVQAALSNLGIMAKEASAIPGNPGGQEGMLSFDEENTSKLISAGIPHPVLEAAGGRIPAALKRGG